MTKREELKEFVKLKDYKNAIKIAKSLDRSYSKDEIRILEIAYECLSSNEKLYLQLGLDIDNIKNEAIILINKS